MRERVVSLNLELAQIESALRGIELLSDGLAHRQLGMTGEPGNAPRYISALLGLTSARVHHLSRVVTGAEDPWHLWTEQNDMDPEALAPDEGDIFLRAWGTKPKAKDE